MQYASQSPYHTGRVLARNDAEFFINTFCWMRDFQRGTEARFKERPIQKALRELIQSRRLVVGLKAREVGWTWELALLSLWEGWKYPPYQCLYIAQREDNAEAFIERIRWAHHKLPQWLEFPKEHGVPTKTRFATKVGNKLSEVLAFPSVPTAIESWHPRRVIADQWGLIPEKVLPSALGAIGLEGYFVGLDTAQGLGNEFADVYLSCRDGMPQMYAPAGRRFHHIFASWKDNPSFSVRPSGGTRRDTERMYPENDQEAFALTAAGSPVYPEFRAALHVSKGPLDAMEGLPIFIGVDFGNTPAAVCFQISGSGQVRILAEWQEMEPGVKRFGRLLIDEFARRWPGFEFIWWGDPSGRTRRDTDGKTCFGILRDEFGVRMNAGGMQWTKRRESVARRLTTLVDGEPGLVIDPSCRILIQGFMGQYAFPTGRDQQGWSNFERERTMGRRARGVVLYSAPARSRAGAGPAASLSHVPCP